ncbi:MAG: nucleotidyltransferase domain-containing protein [Pirellulaceae bacterium]|nr:nucleotidyltransferase domain-containing protein [Pirellulaceae bacterium]
MSSTIAKLTQRGLIRPPSFLPSNVMYETIMGSIAYGVSNEGSDRDIYGFCIPPKEEVFPHLDGEIPGFGEAKQRFTQYQQAHIEDTSAQGGKGVEYDFSIYSIVKYMSLCIECNPNMIDSLFTPQECVLHITQVGSMVREARQLFLHKGCWPKFKGYAYAQLHKMRGKNPFGKRLAIREQFGYDVKFAYHVVRLLGECEQILADGTIDLRRDREHLKAIRRGEVSEEDIFKWASEKEIYLEGLYHESKLPDQPQSEKIRQLLLDCLEHHYGSLEACVVQIDPTVSALRDIRDIIHRVSNVL